MADTGSTNASNWKLKANRLISGQEGTLSANINGTMYNIGDVKNFSAKIELEKKEVRTLGIRGKQQKITGWSGSGSMSLYVISSLWSKIIMEYVNNGKAVYFTLTCTNNDPTTSENGSQTVTLTDVLINGDEIAKLDVDAGFLEKSVDFTFSGVSMTSDFNYNKPNAVV